MKAKDYLTDYYERYDEEGRLSSKHGMVEYLTTLIPDCKFDTETFDSFSDPWGIFE